MADLYVWGGMFRGWFIPPCKKPIATVPFKELDPPGRQFYSLFFQTGQMNGTKSNPLVLSQCCHNFDRQNHPRVQGTDET